MRLLCTLIAILLSQTIATSGNKPWQKILVNNRDPFAKRKGRIFRGGAQKFSENVPSSKTTAIGHMTEIPTKDFSSSTEKDPTGDGVPETVSSKHAEASLERKFDSNFPLSRAFGLARVPFPLLLVLLWIIYALPIPAADLVFSVVFPCYACLANRFRFDNNAAAIKKAGGEYIKPTPASSLGSSIKMYLVFAGVIGVVLPFTMVLIGPAETAKASGPHLYLLLSQIFWERMICGDRFHPYFFIFIPTGFNAYRLLAIRIWLRNGWKAVSETRVRNYPWEVVNFGLAVLNTLLWGYNIFVVQLLQWLPSLLDPDRLPDAKVSWKSGIVPVILREEEGETNGFMK